MNQSAQSLVLERTRSDLGKVKICGARYRSEVAEVARAGADMIGLWYAMPGGTHSLEESRLVKLAHYAQSWGLSPVLVTLSQSVTEMVGAVEATGAGTLQLHAFQRPSVVQRLKEQVPDLQILKVLHISDGVCLESRFLQRYVEAGVDCFLVDAMASTGQVGSTGESVAPTVVEDVIETVPIPVMLAGGLNTDNADGYSSIRAHRRFYGADFDSAARCSRGRLNGRRVAALVDSWGHTIDRASVLAS